jgi:hypothetical protein
MDKGRLKKKYWKFYIAYQKLKKLKHPKAELQKLIFGEVAVSYGPEHENETFYVIRFRCTTCALCGMVFSVALSGVQYALAMNAIPVVDFQSFPNFYLRPKEAGTRNVWEDYFLQPAGYSLSDIANSQNVILSSAVERHIPFRSEIFFGSSQESEAYRATWKAFFQRYARMNPETLAFIEERKRILGIRPTDRFVGVHCRGTDYTSVRPFGHPIQPSVEEMIEKVKETMREYRCEGVLLATEDAQIERTFQNEFGDRLTVAFPAWDRYRDQTDYSREDMTKKQAGLEYLCALSLVAQCACIVHSACGGAYLIHCMAEHPEYEHLFWKGVYGKDDKTG